MEHIYTMEQKMEINPLDQKKSMNDTKKCPYCGEEIMAVAKKCKHCGKWLSEESDQTINNHKETKSEVSTEETPKRNKYIKSSFIIIGIAVFALIVIGALIITSTSTQNYSEEQQITLSSMLYELPHANTLLEKKDIVRKYASDEISIDGISHDIWDTWGSKEDCRLSTKNKAIFDELCSALNDEVYKCIMENDTISVYGKKYSSDLFIVRKGLTDGVYSMDLINTNPDLFAHNLKDRECSEELKELAKSISYEEIMYGKKRGDLKLVFLPHDKYGKKRHLYTIKTTDTIPRPFYPPNGKNWEIVDYFWGDRVSRIIFKNPEAEKSQQMEFWAYDCVDDEWDNKLEAPCLSIKRDNTESVPKLTFTWKTSSGKNVSLTDYTYQSEYKVPRQENNTLDEIDRRMKEYEASLTPEERANEPWRIHLNKLQGSYLIDRVSTAADLDMVHNYGKYVISGNTITKYEWNESSRSWRKDFSSEFQLFKFQEDGYMTGYNLIYIDKYGNECRMCSGDLNEDGKMDLWQSDSIFWTKQ